MRAAAFLGAPPLGLRRAHHGLPACTSATTHAKAPVARALGVVVTGSTLGIGFALAEQFARSADVVVVNSRSAERVESAVALLKHRVPGCQVYGCAGDVSCPGDVRALADFAASKLPAVDVWVCNAGRVATRATLAELSAEDVDSVIRTNLVGALLCSKEATRVMNAQSVPGGHVFLMDGAGSGGNATPSYAAYGASKRAIPQLVSSLSAEARDTPVRFHTCSPGMVLTNLLLAGNPGASSRRFFNWLAEEPATVAKNLVPRIREAALANKPRVYLKFLTLPRAFLQIAACAVFGYRRNRYFNEKGERVDKDGSFDENGVRILSAESDCDSETS